MKQLLLELGIETETVPIYEDNKSAVDLAGNPVYHKRVKHIDIWYHAIREKVDFKKHSLSMISDTDIAYCML